LRGIRRGVNARWRLASGVNFREIGKVCLIYMLVHSISIKGNHKIYVAGRVGQGALPQAFGVSGTLPLPAIFIVYHLPKRNSCLLHDAYVFADVHQKARVARQLRDDALYCGVQGVADVPIFLRFL
jgi:hypothetical protein